jgi:asparagine synthase (glutamine-hydrolysing)
MLSDSSRFVLVFNGEIYNHLELRAQLGATGRAPAWRGHSDTETLLAAIEAWGLQKTLKASVGMFAIALWDKQEKALSLARDRFGEKPLYYGWQNGVLLFGSELKAIGAHPSFERRVNRDAVAQLLRYNYIPAPHSIWQGISKLPQATMITLRIGQTEAKPVAYWSLAEVAEAGQSSGFAGSESDAVDALQDVLIQSVRGQMLADVPLGALLSGGVDSSMVVALMQSQSARQVKTYSIGFHEKQFDESGYARDVSKHLGTDHTELYMSAKDVLSAVPNMPSMYDEPFADSSQLPTSLVMALARQHVTVALSGDGGDELFGGYNRYLMAPKMWRSMKLLPKPLRASAGRALLNVPSERWDRLARPVAGLVKQKMIGDKVHKVGNSLLHADTFDDIYLSLVSQWQSGSPVLQSGSAFDDLLSRLGGWPDLKDPVSRMMALDALTYMPDDVLVKVDRAAMAASLETRAPFLDHRVAELAWRLSASMKIRNGSGKHILRQVLYKHVPRHLIDRPKMGFGIPLDQWLREDLRDWAEALLAPERLSQEGYFDVPMIRDVWQAHLSGKGNHGYRLWSVLMFQAWLQEQG